MAEPLTYQEYKDAKALLDSKQALDPEDLALFQSGVDEYEARVLGKQSGMGAAPADTAAPLAAVIDKQGQAWGPGGSAPTPADLNPDQPVWPQALAAESPVAGPPARDVDEKEWFYKPEARSPGSTVFFYEPPLDDVKRRLMENPQIIQTWLPDMAQFYTPDRIANLTKSDMLYQVVADDDWKQAKAQADEKGVAAYRYSRAPSLQGEHGLNWLSTLGYKVLGSAVPADQAIQSAILGVDSGGYFGALGKLSNASGMREANETAVEENPELNRVGQAVGMFTPSTPSNRLYDFVASGGRALAPGAGVIGRTVISGIGGAAAGGVAQAAEEGVNELDRLARGQPQSNPIDVARRIGGVSAFSGGFGMFGEFAGSAVGHVGERLSEGSAYREIPSRLQRGGAEFSLMEGVRLNPQTQDVIERAKQLDVSPQDVMARDLAPELYVAAKDDLDHAREIVEGNQRSYYASDEGRQELPATNTVETALQVLDLKHGKDDLGRLTENAPSAAKQKVLALFNDQVAGVSIAPVEGAIPLTLDKAGAYLASPHIAQLEEQLRSRGRGENDLVAPDQPFPLAEPQGVDVRPAVDRELLPQHGPERDARPGVGPDKAIPSQPFNDTRGALARQPGQVAGQRTVDVGPQLGPARDAQPGMGLEGRPVPSQPFNDTRGELARAGETRQLDKPRDVLPQQGAEREATPGMPAVVRGVAPHAIKGVGAAAVAYGATSDDENAQYLTAAAGALLPKLRKLGVDTVYVVPKRHDAARQDQMIRDIKGWQEEGKDPPRELILMDKAARKDRDARRAGGQEGGWSRLQDEHEQLIADAETVDRHLGQRGEEGAYQTLVSYGKKQEGEAYRKEAVERAGDAAGRSREVQDLRMLDPLLSLRDAASPFGSSGVRGQRQGFGGLVSRVVDPLVIRGMPAAQAIGNKDGALRGGRAGALARLGEDEPGTEQMPAELSKLHLSDPKVQAWLKNNRELTLDPLKGLKNMFGGAP